MSGTTLSALTFALQGSQKEKREKGLKKVLVEIIAESIPNIGKEIVNKVQEVQRVPGMINPSGNTQDTQ